MMTATMDTDMTQEQHDLHPEGMELSAWLRTAIPIFRGIDSQIKWLAGKGRALFRSLQQRQTTQL